MAKGTSGNAGASSPVGEFDQPTGFENGDENGTFIVDPTAVGGYGSGDGEGSGSSDSGTDNSGGRRGRGRPRKNGGTRSGSNSGKKKTGSLASVDAIGNLLYGIHQGLSTFVPELELDKPEAHYLGTSVATVASQYDVGVSEKAAAWAGLFICVGTVYGPRLAAYKIRVMTTPKELPHETPHVPVT